MNVLRSVLPLASKLDYTQLNPEKWESIKISYGVPRKTKNFSGASFED
jgi:hypothetical protein